MRPSSLIPLSILAFGVIIAGALFFSFKAPAPEDGAIGTPTQMRPITDADHILGNPAAPVVLVEYADPECAYCTMMRRALEETMAAYGPTGDVAWVYRHLPIPTETSTAPAVAAECAARIGGNDAFFRFLRGLDAATTAGATSTPSRLAIAARAAGLNEDAFVACTKSSEAEDAVAKDAKDALLAGATGVPYTIVMVEDSPALPISGAVSAAQLKQIIDATLAGIK